MRRQILVVDDDPSTTDALADLFETEGYGVLKAADGCEALEVLSAQPAVSLVVTDASMPNMDGKELLERLHQDARFMKIPVIVVCASERFVEELKDRAEAAMLKPVNPTKLLNLVANLYIGAGVRGLW